MSIFTVVAGVLAAELTPPSVFLGLDPRIHAGIHQQRAMDPRLKAWDDGGWGEACRHASPHLSRWRGDHESGNLLLVRLPSVLACKISALPLHTAKEEDDEDA
uniref:Uncharacterized protein n=1 Tax=Rhizobium leguminosarum TaxID=384 RepID=A0A154IJI0_RHILE|nr:hypothetical protein A4A59_16905 [Rhizobium leguminosarum]